MADWRITSIRPSRHGRWTGDFELDCAGFHSLLQAYCQAFLRRELREHTIVPKPGATLDLKIRDDDAWVRGSTVLAQSDALVKGDKDLLDVAESSPIPILSPRDCWQWLRG